MKIASVTISGLKSARNNTYMFSPTANYIHGPNGSGKTTILQAIQFGLLGYVPGLAKTDAATSKLASENTISVQLVLQDDIGCYILTRTLQKSNSGRTTKTFKCVGPAGEISEKDLYEMFSAVELPIFNFQKFLDMSANGQKDKFIQLFPVTGIHLDGEDFVKSALERCDIDDTLETVAHVVSEYSSKLTSANSVADIVQIHNDLKLDLSVYKKDIDRINKSIQSIALTDAYDIIDDDPKEIRNKLQNTITIQKEAAQQRIIQVRIESLKKRMKAVCEETIAHKAAIMDEGLYEQSKSAFLYQIDELNDVIDKLHTARDDKQEEINKLKIELAQLNRIADCEGICPYLETQCAKLVGYAIDTKNNVKSISSAIDGACAAKTQIEEKISAKTAECREFESYLRSLSNSRKEYVGLKNEYDQLKLQQKPDMYQSDEAYSNQIAELTDKLSKLSAASQTDKLYVDWAHQQLDIEQVIALISELIVMTDANHLQSQLTNARFVQLEDELTDILSKIMPDTKASFILNEKSNSFEFGALIYDKYIPFAALSSGEKCIYMISLMIAICKSDSTKLKCILIDDSLDNLDSSNLARLADVLPSAGIQIIAAGVNNLVKRNASSAEPINQIEV